LDLPTAFRARAGVGPLHIGICAEYDCLPGIGHACGHNIIAASALGAALAAAKVADELGLTVSVIGTPAEEVGNASGKILLLERGGFAGIHAAMTVHPAPFDMLRAKIMMQAANIGSNLKNFGCATLALDNTFLTPEGRLVARGDC
jgi:metal-dependent amidase/aminoacylase/carboxypeptidase family protein